MNIKSLLSGTVAGTIVYFMLGWLFYGILFTDIYPDNGNQNLTMVFLGCLTFCLMLSYIIVKSGVEGIASGATTGGIIGLLYGAGMNFFMYSSQAANVGLMVKDILINALMGAIAGALIGWVVQKVK
jgi:hypothetical protein